MLSTFQIMHGVWGWEALLMHVLNGHAYSCCAETAQSLGSNLESEWQDRLLKKDESPSLFMNIFISAFAGMQIMWRRMVTADDL
jgi:hypothetical protein